MAMAAGFRSGHGMYLLGNGEVVDQAMCPWKKSWVRLQQQRDAGSRGRLCTVVCSTSGRGNQARRKVKGPGPPGRRAADKPSQPSQPSPPRQPSQKDVRLEEQLRNFIAEHDLPPTQLPSIKELMSKGRLDLANAVRSRGYKAAGRMLAQPKVRSGMTSSSSDSESGEPGGGEPKLEVNLLVGGRVALDSAGNTFAAATEEAKGDGAGSPEASLASGVTPEDVTGGQTDFLSSLRTAVVRDKDGADHESPNAQLDAAIAAENEGGRVILPLQPAALLEQKLARLTEAVSEFSFERARIEGTGESSLLQEAKGDDAGSPEVSLGNGGTPGNVTGGQMDFLTSLRTRDKDGTDDVLTDDESPNPQLDGAIAAENEGGRAILPSQPTESLRTGDKDGTDDAQLDGAIAAENEGNRTILPSQPAALLGERLARLTESLGTMDKDGTDDEWTDDELTDDELQNPQLDGAIAAENEGGRVILPSQPAALLAERLARLTESLRAIDKDWTYDELPNAQLDGESPAQNEGGRVIPPSPPAALLGKRLARLTEAVTELSFQERARMFVETGESSLLQEPDSPKPANGWARLDTEVGVPKESAGRGRMQQTNEVTATADDLQNAGDYIHPGSELQAGQSKKFSFTKQWDKSKASNSSNAASVLESAERSRRAPISEDLSAPHDFSRSLDLEFDDDSDDSDIEFLDAEDEAFPKLSTTQDRITTGRDSIYELSNKLGLNGNSPWKDNEPGVAVQENEETVGAQEIEQILSILAKQREIGRLMQRDKELDTQFMADAQVELDKIKSVLQFRESKTAKLRQALLEAQAELLLVKERAASDLEEAMQMLAEKDALLKRSQLALVRLKEVTLEWWGQGTKVELSGSFNGWQHFFELEPDLTSEIPNFDGSRGPMLWCLDIRLYPGVYEIKFMVDGIWTLDHRREMVMQSGHMQNNLLRVDC